MRRLCLSFIIFSFIVPVWCSAALLSFDKNGLQIDAGSMGKFTWSYPIMLKDGDTPYKILTVWSNGNSATITYEGGGSLSAVIGADGGVDYTYSNIPGDVKNFRYEMLIGFDFQQGGEWKTQNKSAAPFSVTKPANPHLFSDHTKTFALTNFEHKTLAFAFTDYSWVDLTDNREWNWATYDLKVIHPWIASNPTYTFNFSLSDGSSTPVTLVDEFGQVKTGDWPLKINKADELRADVQSEQAYYAGMKVPKLDSYGGLPNSGLQLGLNPTGFFHVQRMDKKWALVDPDGNLFFHTGVCGCSPCDDYTRVSGREAIYDWLPPEKSGEFESAYLPNVGGGIFSFYLANLIRKYGHSYNLEDFQARMLDRIRLFGFNSIGDFASLSLKVIQSKNFPYVAGLPLDGISSIAGLREVWDPYDSNNLSVIDKDFAELKDHANDPLLLGYFLTNEPSYEDIPKVVPTLKGTQNACKRAFVMMLRKKYSTIDAFNIAWKLKGASFEELNDTALDVATQQAFEDTHEFSGEFLDAYFRVVRQTFDKYDSHHMLIGCRLQPGTINSEQLCRTAGKYLDIMSFNYYTDGLDKDFLKRVYAWTGRPFMLSEFFWSSTKESGLVGAQGVGSQQDRGLAYRNYVENAASLGFVVGIEWFTLVDQSATGRWFEGLGGERANTGLFSVVDRPWKPMIEEMKKTNDSIYDVVLRKRAPYVFSNSQFVVSNETIRETDAPRALGSIAINGTTANWPGNPPDVISGKGTADNTQSVEGTFRLCWDDKNLYVLVNVLDATPMQNKQTDPAYLWSGDALELFVGSERIHQGGPLLFTDRHLVIGAGTPGKALTREYNGPSQYDCGTTVVPGGDGKSYAVEFSVPWKELAIAPKSGQELLFDVGIDDSADGMNRKQQVMWNGTEKNAGDRTHWGHLKLLP